MTEQPMGLSFSPMGGPDQKEGQAGGQTPIQDAIKVLSLQMPRFSGAGRLAPDPLLQSFGSGGIVGGNNMPGGLEMFLRQLFGHLLPFGQGGASPIPSVVPGIQQPGAPAGGPPPIMQPQQPRQAPQAPSLPLNPPIEVPPYGMPQPQGRQMAGVPGSMGR